jgi:hypothetical protein
MKGTGLTGKRADPFQAKQSGRACPGYSEMASAFLPGTPAS